MATSYDAIVIGARCAGSPTAMLLARKGYRVLLLDRASFPSDTMSTHVVHPLAAASLKRWGVLDRLLATGCPPIDTYTLTSVLSRSRARPVRNNRQSRIARGEPFWTSCSSRRRLRPAQKSAKVLLWTRYRWKTGG